MGRRTTLGMGGGPPWVWEEDHPGYGGLPTILGMEDYLPPWVWRTTYHPGYIPCCTPLGTPSYTAWSVPSMCTVGSAQNEESLGSNLRIIKEKERMRAFLSSFLLGLEDCSAQSCSALPGTFNRKIG